MSDQEPFKETTQEFDSDIDVTIKPPQGLEELREKCQEVQYVLGIDDEKWEHIFDTKEGLYGYILPIVSRELTKARIDEAKQCMNNLHDNRECSTCYGNYCRIRDHVIDLESHKQKGKKDE